MRERFPIKKRGDGLTAAHVNALSSVCRSYASQRDGGGQFGYRGSWAGSAADQAHIEQFAKVRSLFGSTAGVYWIRLRYFDHEDEEWKDDDEDYELDARGYSADESDPQRSPVLLYGDLITIRYDEQRGLFVPVKIPSFDRWALTPVGGIPARDGATEYGEVCKFVKQTLASNGETITWSYLKNASDADVEYRVFNGFPDAIAEQIHIKVGYNSIGQWSVKAVPCSEDGPLAGG